MEALAGSLVEAKGAEINHLTWVTWGGQVQEESITDF